MAFKNRVVEYPNRYLFEDDQGNQTGPYTLIRDEGQVTEPGTLLNAENLNSEVGNLINAKITAGKTASVTVAGGTYSDITVTFDQAFTAPPVVVAGFFSSSTSGTFGRCCASVHSVTATGCKVRVFNGDAGSRIPSVEWIAVGV